jgi:outer membrane lipase/esterase
MGFALVAGTAASEPASFRQIVVFGDSLSDTGNTQAAPYSNDGVWVQYLAAKLGLAVKPSSIGGTNYAVGGAWASGPEGSSSLQAQAASFLRTRPADLGSTLVVVYGGGNDLLAAYSSDNPRRMAEEAAAAILNISDRIGAAGGIHLLVPNLPDLSVVPAVRAHGPSAMQAAAELTRIFNHALDVGLTDLARHHRQLRLYRLDVHALAARVFADPTGSGLAAVNLTEPCLHSERPCADPAKFLFWDTIHPTAVGHQRLAEAAYQVLSAK